MPELTPGFRIEPGDMRKLGNSFHNFSVEYQQALPGVITVPRGGSTAIDRAMATTLKVVNEMHTMLYEAMAKHSVQLKRAASEFLRVEGQTRSYIQQVQNLISLGESVKDSEDAIVDGYLSGRPSYMAPPPSEPPSIDKNPAKRLGEVPNAVKISPRLPWVQFQYSILSFDYSGLWRLADDLNNFLMKGDPLMIDLSRRVVDFCAPYRNYGDTVYEFNATFSEDASLASGFHRIVSEISATIDKFANEMAEKEVWLENYARKCNVPEGALQALSNLSSGRARGAVDGVSLNRRFIDAARIVLVQASRLRKETAAALLLFVDAITSGGLDYYTKKDTGLGSADPGGLFGGKSAELVVSNQLEGEVRKDGELLHASSQDLKDAVADLATTGQYGGQIGSIMGGIEGLQESESLLASGKNIGGIAGSLGPILLGLAPYAPAIIE